MFKLLVVEDDRELNRAVCSFLNRNGYDALGCLSANEAYDAMCGAPKGHPVFLAQHATATCCRGCLEKWHGIEKGRALSDDEQRYVADVIMRWISRQMDNSKMGL